MLNKSLILLVTFLLFWIGCGAEELFREKDAPVISNIFPPERVVNKGDTVKIRVEASDPEGGELTYEWSADAGNFIGFTQTDSVKWIAPLIAGDFDVRIKVSNKYKSTSAKSEITVLSTNKPAVNISSPNDNTYLVQYEPVTIEVQAVHENGIFDVDLYINDILLQSLPGNDDDLYEFNWNVSVDPGVIEIKAIARSRVTLFSAADSINVNIEAILPGKK